jgi:hypothetical protein
MVSPGVPPPPPPPYRRHHNGVTRLYPAAIGGPAAHQIGKVDLLGNGEEAPRRAIDGDVHLSSVPGEPDDFRRMPQRFRGRGVATRLHRVCQPLELRREPPPVAIGPRPGCGVAAAEQEAGRASDEQRSVSQRAELALSVAKGGRADMRTVMVSSHTIQYSSGAERREMLVLTGTLGSSASSRAERGIAHRAIWAPISDVSPPDFSLRSK